MSVDPTPASTPEIRFREVFDQAPISMQLVAADGRTLQVNKAWEAMWQGSLGDALKEYVLHGGYNLLSDPQLEAKGVTPYLRRAFAGEAVNVPAILYDPAEMGIIARPRWVTSRAQPIKDAQGRVAEVMLMHEDITDRVEADDSLRLSEQRFRSLVTASSQIVWNSDSEGLIIDDSPSWRLFTGQTYEQWKGVGWLDAIHPDDRQRAASIWTSAIANKAVYQTEYRIMHADGDYRWTSVRAVPLYHGDGSIREWIGTNTDITEQRRAEEALRNNEQRLRFMFDSMQQKIFTATPDGKVDYFNPAWIQFSGLSPESIRDWGWTQMIHPDDIDESIRVWTRSLEHGEAFQVEQRCRRADGQYRWHLSRAVPMRDEAGRLAMWIGSNTDIHEVKIVESELARRLQAERRHSAVLAKVAAASNQLHTAVSVDDIARDLVGIVRDILGVHQAVISLNAGDNWAQSINAVSMSDKYARYAGYTAPPDGTGIYATVCRTNKAMRMTQDELERHPDWKGFGAHRGQHPPMRGWLAVPLKAHDGANIGLLQASDKEDGEFTEEDEAILTQLASLAATGFENARLYDTLQEQHRRKDEFLAMLAHELRNPLAPIRAAADLLSIANLGEDRIRQTSAVISRQVQHMSSLVDDLLDISRVTRGLVELAGADLDIKRVVADAVEQVRPLVEARLHELTVTSSAEPAHVRGDHKRLVQIVANILNNAAKYTQRGGRIVVRTETTGSDVVISVEDNGAGVPPELQPYVFDLFSQAERSADRAQGGLGIGLALVKSLVGLHGGQVTCHSDGPGTGSRFTVTLPRLASDAAASVQDGRKLPVQPTHRLRILVVDDNVDAARMLAMYLEAAGHEVMVEHKALAGLQRALRDKPAVCILDIGLPDMDGNELARALRRHPDMAGALLVAATGYGSERDRENALAAGFDHHLVKPVNSSVLSGLLAATRAR
ncbi:PAS domain S-box protein [Massilia sp. GCM10020059]|uniref:histidine kinase n=1 Tax=Massilia agrisoli TaxID=2892444 RepID=A0ABS8IUH3_9BURK|nr:PAS domain S-box protein [Massilia agrisoli]MCC6070915.1 PAS domain S-box protein [Massilia agrisoli]